MYILKPTLDEAGIKKTRAHLEGILTSNGGKIIKETIWGLKEFMTPIDKYTKGYYVIIDVEAQPQAVLEFNRLTRINKDELRHMILNIEKEKI